MLIPFRTATRSLSRTRPAKFLNVFSKNDLKKKDIIEKQDDFESDPEKKIVILNKDNSPAYPQFDPVVDLEGFKVAQWKLNVVSRKDIESTYTTEKLNNIISTAYTELSGKAFNDTVELNDLEFRFKLAKELQSRLGFDIGDYVLTKSHNIGILQLELQKVIGERWSNERNPNGIVLRAEDFEAPNIYLNEELNEKEQKKLFAELAEKAKGAESN